MHGTTVCKADPSKFFGLRLALTLGRAYRLQLMYRYRPIMILASRLPVPEVSGPTNRELAMRHSNIATPLEREEAVTLCLEQSGRGLMKVAEENKHMEQR